MAVTFARCAALVLTNTRRVFVIKSIRHSRDACSAPAARARRDCALITWRVNIIFVLARMASLGFFFVVRLCVIFYGAVGCLPSWAVVISCRHFSMCCLSLKERMLALTTMRGTCDSPFQVSVFFAARARVCQQPFRRTRAQTWLAPSIDQSNARADQQRAQEIREDVTTSSK